MCVGPASPRFGPKECDESGMHTHLLFAAFQVTFVSPYFLVANVTGAAVQITQLYNSGVERLKNKEDWPCVWPAFNCDLWKSAMNKKYFTCMAHLVRDKVGGGLELKRRVKTTCEVPAETISAQVSDELLAICFATPSWSRKAVQRLVLEVKL